VAVCASCGESNPSTSKFCGACGSTLTGTTCPSCDAPNPATNRFCGQCGASLTEGNSPGPVDERKLATVLFADVVGFTTLAETTDPETVARTVDAAFRRLAEVVADHGGTVDKYMGDSLMAVFGVPVAHGDDAERAVAAALAMRHVGGDLAFSIGVNTGEVMVTAVGHVGAVTVIGDTVNVAARLEKVAGPGEVLVGALTARLTADGVNYGERRPVVVKGRREPVEVCEALGLVDTVDAGAPVANQPPLIGRDDELAFLESQWRRAVRDERANVVLVVGDVGVGTTRVVEELCSRLAEEAHTVRATYPAYGALGGPRVAAELVRQLGATGDDEIDAKVRSTTGEFDPNLRRIDPATFRSEQVWAVWRLLAAKAADRPILVVIDAAHRIGEATLELISAVATRAADLPILVVLVGRPEPSTWLTHFGGATRLQLSALGADDARRLAGALAGDLPLDDEAAHFLVERSRGNPLYLRELVTVARERGQLVARDGRLGLASEGGIPPGLHALVAARLDALAPSEKLAVQHLAVLGHAASPEEVEAMGLDGASEVLTSLERLGLLRRPGAEDRWDVADALLGEVAYETLPRHVRVERHRRVAEAAASTEERARHLARATTFGPEDEELRAEAAAALGDAGIEVLDAYRHLDAVRLLRQAVELGDARPETSVRLAEVLSTLARRVEAIDVLDGLPPTTDPNEQARRLHMRAAAISFEDPAQALVPLEEAARRWSELGNVVQDGWAHANRGVALFTLGRMREASAELHEGLTRFEAAGDRNGAHAVHAFLGLVHPTDPRVPEWMEEGVRYADEVGDRTMQVGALVTLTWHRFLRFRLGSTGVDDAEESARRLVGLADELGNGDFALHGASLAANLARMTGRLDEASAAAVPICRLMEKQSPAWPLGAAVLFGLALASGEDVARPAPFDSPDPVVTMASTLVAEALVLADRPDEAMAVFADWDSRPDLATVDRLGPGLVMAMARVFSGRAAEARPVLESLLTSVEEASYGSYVAVVRALLAEVELRAGDEASARRLLPAPLSDEAPSIAHAFALRAAALLGDEDARLRLVDVAAALHVPGLVAGLR
jgi:class 3 adenylate cyclase/tetratricopeptide (TPR) repeat protein